MDAEDMSPTSATTNVVHLRTASVPPTPRPAPPATIKTTAIQGEQVILRPAQGITPRPIDWMWNGWLARGKLHVLAGPPGSGKTNLVIALSAALSCGGYLPGGARAEPCHVVIWSGEDSIEDTLVPRLIACGSDLSRIHFVQSVKTRKGINRPFDPAVDIPLLRSAITQYIGNVGLLTVDSVASVVLGDGHKNNQVRRSLQPLVDLADDCQCAVIGITHLTKASADRDPIDRIVGSVAFGGVARIVLMAVKIAEEHGGGRLLVRVKSNIGPDDGGFKYQVRQVPLEGYPNIETSHVEWSDAIPGTPKELLAMAETLADPEERSAVIEAQEFIREALSSGEMMSATLERRAEESGIAKRTLKRARSLLRVEVIKVEGGLWRCRLPTK